MAKSKSKSKVNPKTGDVENQSVKGLITDTAEEATSLVADENRIELAERDLFCQ